MLVPIAVWQNNNNNKVVHNDLQGGVDSTAHLNARQGQVSIKHLGL